MKILVINSGSSSIKYQLFQMPEEKVIAKGLLERIGEEKSLFVQKSIIGEVQSEKSISDHEAGIDFIIGMLTDPHNGVVTCIEEIFGVGHRVVHGGEEFNESVVVTDEVMKKIAKYSDLAPLHNPPNLIGIRACRKSLPKAIQVACFDTAFHHSIPKEAFVYAIPYELYQRYGIRKYGFHGTSHKYVSTRYAALAKKNIVDLNLITCHLGNGCSIAAIEKGKSVDTSMGFTPLEGLVMGTRCGDIDPAITFYLLEKGYSGTELNTLLNKKSGLLGISGVSNDMRNLLQAQEKGDLRAKLAIDIFSYRIKKYIGSYMAILGKVDAVIFTGGIGENNAFVRQRSLKNLDFLGIELDETLNNKATKGFEGKINKETSKVEICVIPTNEELQIAVDTAKITKLKTAK